MQPVLRDEANPMATARTSETPDQVLVKGGFRAGGVRSESQGATVKTVKSAKKRKRSQTLQPSFHRHFTVISYLKFRPNPTCPNHPFTSIRIVFLMFCNCCTVFPIIWRKNYIFEIGRTINSTKSNQFSLCLSLYSVRLLS